jgi:hypothetical protein
MSGIFTDDVEIIFVALHAMYIMCDTLVNPRKMSFNHEVNNILFLHDSCQMKI